MAAAEKAGFLKNAEEKTAGYSMDGLKEAERLFGIFILKTNDAGETPEKMYNDYKSRWGIETYYDYVDNSQKFIAMYRRECHSFQGVSFLMTVSGQVFEEMKSAVKGISLKDSMNSLGAIKIVMEGKNWTVRNTPKYVRVAAEKVGFDIPDYFVQ